MHGAMRNEVGVQTNQSLSFIQPRSARIKVTYFEIMSRITDPVAPKLVVWYNPSPNVRMAHSSTSCGVLCKSLSLRRANASCEKCTGCDAWCAGAAEEAA